MDSVTVYNLTLIIYILYLTERKACYKRLGIYCYCLFISSILSVNFSSIFADFYRLFMPKFKGSVRFIFHFHLKFNKRQPLKNDEKWFLFHIKSSFHSQDIKLLYLLLSLFSALTAIAGRMDWINVSKLMTSWSGQTIISKYILIAISEVVEILHWNLEPW